MVLSKPRRTVEPGRSAIRRRLDTRDFAAVSLRWRRAPHAHVYRLGARDPRTNNRRESDENGCQ